MADDPGGDAAHEQAGQAGEAVAAHDDPVGLDLFGLLQDAVIGRGAGAEAGLQVHPQFGGLGPPDLQAAPHRGLLGRLHLQVDRGRRQQVRGLQLIQGHEGEHLQEIDLAAGGLGQVQGRGDGPLAVRGLVGADQQFFQMGGGGHGKTPFRVSSFELKR